MTRLRSMFALLFLILGVLMAVGCISHVPQETQRDDIVQTPVIVPVTTLTSDPVMISKAILKFPEPGNATHSVTRGDRYYITGVVNDSAESFVAIWIFGKNFTQRASESINSNGSYKYEIRQESTNDLEPGPYYIIIQYPGENGRFDILPDLVNISERNFERIACCSGYSHNASNKSQPGLSFLYREDSCLNGFPAAAALTEALDDPAVDDRYTTGLIMVEDPWIRVNPTGIIRAGDWILINGTTNLAIDDELQVQIYPSGYTPDRCGRELSPDIQRRLDESGYATRTIKVTRGTGESNRWNFDSDEIHGPDEFRLEVTAIIQDGYNRTLFRIENNNTVQIPEGTPSTTQYPEVNRSLRSACGTSGPA
jgi:trimeric autotransporter adhesin